MLGTEQNIILKGHLGLLNLPNTRPHLDPRLTPKVPPIGICHNKSAAYWHSII